MAKEIIISRGQVAIVDDEDYEAINSFKWRACPRKDTFYAKRNAPREKDGSRKHVYMHRQIMDKAGVLHVDHINHNGLDNRRSNLRLATRMQNLANLKTPRSNTTGFKGVRKNSSAAWTAYLNINNRYTHIGCYPTKEDAARGYDRAAIQQRGVFALTNFPREDYL